MVNDKFQVTSLETWFDPLDMFRQLTPKDIKANGKPLNDEATTDRLQGKEGIQAAQALTEQTEGTVLATMDEVKLPNPNLGDKIVHEHQETRTANGVADVPLEKDALEASSSDMLFGFPIPPGHPKIRSEAAEAGACSFFAAQANNNQPVEPVKATPSGEPLEITQDATLEGGAIPSTSDVVSKVVSGLQTEKVPTATNTNTISSFCAPPTSQLEPHVESIEATATPAIVEIVTTPLPESPEVPIETTDAKTDLPNAP
jgi:hypothetical protein